MTNLPASHAKQVAEFLQKQRTVRGRIAFVIDATASREPTWDAASQLQSEMFAEAAKLGGLEMMIAYFRGADEVGASNWTATRASSNTSWGAFAARVATRNMPGRSNACARNTKSRPSVR